MPLQDLLVGDIIIQTDEGEPEHSLMWVGTGKPVVHSAEGDKLNGVVQQSVGCFEDLSKSDLDETEVWRCRDSQLAARAAKFAIRWATRSDEPWVIKAWQSGQQLVTLRTPFSQDRLTETSDKENTPMSVFALWRAVRAAARGNAGQDLSPATGVSCAMFVTYCYQAASLEDQLGLLPQEWEKLRQLKNSGALMALSKEQQFNLIRAALEPITTGNIPPAFLVDAKRTNVDRLHDSLEQDPAFSLVGYVVTNKDQKATHAYLLPESEAGQREWADVRTEMRDVKKVPVDPIPEQD
jgi:hypothetical protein